MKIDPRLAGIARSQRYPLVFATVSGAHLYGFESEDSDWDLRGVHVLPVENVVGLDTGPETIQVAEIRDDLDLDLDLVTHDLLKFARLLLKHNGYVLEQLYSPLVLESGESHEELKEIASDCITSNARHHYRGFAQTEWRLFEKGGHSSLKPLLYVFRVLKTGIHLMRTGKVEANLTHLLDEPPVVAYLADLVGEKRSRGERSTITGLDIVQVAADVARLQEVLELTGLESHLPPESSARGALHEFVVRTRLQVSLPAPN